MQIGKAYANRKTGHTWTVRAIYECTEASDGSDGAKVYRLEKDAKQVQARSIVIGKAQIRKKFISAQTENGHERNCSVSLG